MKANIHLMHLDGHGGATELSPEQFKQEKGLVWAHLDITSAKQFLKNIASCSPLVEEILSAKATRPRTLAHNDALIATFRSININKGSKLEDMVSIRLWIHKNMIITVQRRNVTVISDIEDSLKTGIGPKNPADFLETLLDTINDKSAEVVNVLSNRFDSIEDELTKKFDQIDRTTLNDMRRRIILLRRYLIPQREAISRLPVDKLSWLNETNMMHLREIIDASTRILEDIDAERERATVIHEELFALAQEAINKKMYLLSIVAMIFMPLSFVTGLLGINVEGIPGAHFRYGFLLVCILLLFIFGLQLILLKRKRWI